MPGSNPARGTFRREDENGGGGIPSRLVYRPKFAFVSAKIPTGSTNTRHRQYKQMKRNHHANRMTKSSAKTARATPNANQQCRQRKRVHEQNDPPQTLTSNLDKRNRHKNTTTKTSAKRPIPRPIDNQKLGTFTRLSKFRLHIVSRG